jgi:Skp family chaperone for outer membrane proteins
LYRLKSAIEKQLKAYNTELIKLEKEVHTADKAFQQQMKAAEKKSREEEVRLHEETTVYDAFTTTRKL